MIKKITHHQSANTQNKHPEIFTNVIGSCLLFQYNYVQTIIIMPLKLWANFKIWPTINTIYLLICLCSKLPLTMKEKEKYGIKKWKGTNVTGTINIWKHKWGLHHKYSYIHFAPRFTFSSNTFNHENFFLVQLKSCIR